MTNLYYFTNKVTKVGNNINLFSHLFNHRSSKLKNSTKFLENKKNTC